MPSQLGRSSKTAVSKGNPKVKAEPQPVAVDPRRQAPITTKQSRAGKKSASAKSKKSVRGKGKEKGRKTSHSALKKATTEQRDSFVIRVTVDKQGQPRRTEVEHVRSGKKDNFPSLDVEQLAGFMRECLGSPVQSESVNAAPLSPTPGEGSRQESTKYEVNVIISSVVVSRARRPDSITKRLIPDEDFLVAAYFRLQGRDASSVAARESSYQIKVFAQEATSGTSKLVTAYRANLAKDVLEYTTQVDVPGLPPGLYRLITRVTLLAPVYVAAHYEGPIMQVSKTQAPDSAGLEKSIGGVVG